MPKQYVNPPTLFPSQQYGFSQIVTSRGGTTVYLAGQVAWDPDRAIGAPDDLGMQTQRTLANVETALQAVGGSRTDIVSMRIYLVGDHIHNNLPVQQALLAFFPSGQLPSSTWIGVPALAHPDFLIEIEAVAVVE